MGEKAKGKFTASFSQYFRKLERTFFSLESILYQNGLPRSPIQVLTQLSNSSKYIQQVMR